MCSKIINWRICNASDASKSKESLDLVFHLIKHIYVFPGDFIIWNELQRNDKLIRCFILIPNFKSSLYCLTHEKWMKQQIKHSTYIHFLFCSLNPLFILRERQKRLLRERVFVLKRLPIRLSSPSVLWLNLATLSMTTNKRWWLEFVNKQKLKEEKNSKQQQIAR